MLTKRQLPVRGNADELEFNKVQRADEDSQTTSNKQKTTIHQPDPTRGWQENSDIMLQLYSLYV